MNECVPSPNTIMNARVSSPNTIIDTHYGAGAPPDELTSRVASLSESQYPPLGVKHIIAQLAGDGVPHRCGGAGCATYLFNTKSCARRECLPARRASEGFDSAWSGSVYLAFGKACDIIAIPTREYIINSHADAVERGGLLALYGPSRVGSSINETGVTGAAAAGWKVKLERGRATGLMCATPTGSR